MSRDRFDTEDLEIIRASAVEAARDVAHPPNRIRKTLELVGMLLAIAGSAGAGLWAVTTQLLTTKAEAAEIRKNLDIKVSTRIGSLNADMRDITAAMKDTAAIDKVQDVQLDEHKQRFQRIERRLERIEDRLAQRANGSP